MTDSSAIPSAGVALKDAEERQLVPQWETRQHLAVEALAECLVLPRLGFFDFVAVVLLEVVIAWRGAALDEAQCLDSERSCESYVAFGVKILDPELEESWSARASRESARDLLR